MEGRLNAHDRAVIVDCRYIFLSYPLFAYGSIAVMSLIQCDSRLWFLRGGMFQSMLTSRPV